MNDVIDIQGLHKAFGSTQALDGLDLTVTTGEVHGFLGPNGAGKSTTIRVLLGLLRADAGTVRLFGGDPWRDAAELHRRLAYVPGDVNLWPTLTGGEVIDLLGRLRGGIDERRRADLIERFELDPTKKGRAYSKGNRQKVALVAALASDVELLVLDEPTSGLDPLMEAVFTECIDDFKDEGRSVLLSSHILAEVERLCDRVSIIRSGPRRGDRHAGRPASPHPDVRRGRGRLPADRSRRHWSGVHDLVVEGHRVLFEVDTDHLGAAIDALGAARHPHAHQPAADAGGAVPAPLRRRRHRRSRRGHGMTGTSIFIRMFLRRDRWMLFWWIAGVDAALLQPGAQHGRHLHDPGRVRQGRGEHGEQRRLHRDDRPGARARHDRRAGGLAGDGLRRDPRRPHEHVHRRPAHAGRGGVGPRRARAGGRRRAGTHPWSRRSSWRPWPTS